MRIVYLILISLIMATPVSAAQSGELENTLYVSGEAVVFFAPSQAEYLAMSDKEKDEIDQELYEFYHFRGKVLSFLEQNNIQEFSTARLKIHIQRDGSKNIIYFRKGFDHVVGLIMTDGYQEPAVLLGSATNSVLISMFKAYFDLE